jgi:cytidine deaminase
MISIRDSSQYPELIFGIAGPIGVDVPAICESLADALRAVRYESHVIHLTTEMMSYQPRRRIRRPVDRNFYNDVIFKIEYANALCEEFEDSATLARIALRSVANKRRAISGNIKRLPPIPTAYIVRQLKRPEEVALLRRVYGRQFVLISAYGSLEQRLRLLEERLKRSLSPSTAATEISSKAHELTTIDAVEEGNEFGQRLRETFHRADVFIDGLAKREMDQKIDRFIQAFFGRTDIAPTKEEYGMYAAKSASLRSSDLSRQVGAAVFSDDGELITQGCNEVPKAMGGTYWDSEEPDFRDVRLGFDPNDILKKDILRDLIDRLSGHGLLSAKAKKMGPLDEMIKKLTYRKKRGSNELDGALTHSLVMDVTEYGRVVHAEMCAICDAARLGRSVKGATLFCTTFPCHNCTKHILAAGIKRVVYMEPYPKSKAKDLHENEIEIEKETPGRVSFVPFLGISPYRYRDIFQKSAKRKKDDGTALRWLTGREAPMIDGTTGAYVDIEWDEYSSFIVEFRKGNARQGRAARKAARPARGRISRS